MSSVKPTAEDITAAQVQWVSPALTRWYGEEGTRQNIGPDGGVAAPAGRVRHACL
ncbi:hypothetical protein [Nesterenkonia cremea]|uniref:Uncharacterized protein n=1 Tax=Nesterenkonia cremea TaxID=1882340 RepID=A0A917AM24_9MICC|nr:hypothetical protein [Nesterenkonia cremea]GGE57988.1 hypothetical protein GCM10011401_00910 [Nesterenkonia cremea]